jgi:predicted glycosyltransferase involved in capsule biosynthesis
MSKIFNSIIVCHKNRRWSLRAFLQSFYLASKYINRDTYEVVITDMDGDINNKLINKYKKYFNIKHLKVRYNGIFWGSKALNHSVLNSEGKYITHIDIDSIITKYFLPGIVKFYSEKRNKNIKLAHRIFSLCESEKNVVIFGSYNEDFINGLINNVDNHVRLEERYTELGIRKFNNEKIEKDWLDNKAIGNSHYTMLKSVFLELGGYDERFKGWGYEDTDFNIRAYKILNGGRIRVEPKNVLFNIPNFYSKKNMSVSIVSRNRGIYKENKKNNVIKIKKDVNWGEFEE